MEGTFTTGENGKFCITGLPNDSEWLVTEIQAPPGYQLADPASQLVEVDDDGDCNSPSATFVNALATRPRRRRPKARSPVGRRRRARRRKDRSRAAPARRSRASPIPPWVSTVVRARFRRLRSVRSCWPRWARSAGRTSRARGAAPRATGPAPVSTQRPPGFPRGPLSSREAQGSSSRAAGPSVPVAYWDPVRCQVPPDALPRVTALRRPHGTARHLTVTASQIRGTKVPGPCDTGTLLHIEAIQSKRSRIGPAELPSVPRFRPVPRRVPTSSGVASKDSSVHNRSKADDRPRCQGGTAYMTLRANPFRALPILLAFFLNVVIGPLAPLTQLASAPVLALSGSSFDATDGNFAVNGGETDWCSASLAVTAKNDLPTGQNDDSYAEGAKESDRQSAGRDGLDPEQQGRPDPPVRRRRDGCRRRSVRLRRMAPQRRQRHRHHQLRDEPVRRHPEQRGEPGADRRRPADHLQLPRWRLRVAGRPRMETAPTGATRPTWWTRASGEGSVNSR